MMLHIQRLTALTALRLGGSTGVSGDAPVAALATCLPPDLAFLQLGGLNHTQVSVLRSLHDLPAARVAPVSCWQSTARPAYMLCQFLMCFLY